MTTIFGTIMELYAIILEISFPRRTQVSLLYFWIFACIVITNLYKSIVTTDITAPFTINRPTHFDNFTTVKFKLFSTEMTPRTLYHGFNTVPMSVSEQRVATSKFDMDLNSDYTNWRSSTPSGPLTSDIHSCNKTYQTLYNFFECIAQLNLTNATVKEIFIYKGSLKY